MAALVAANVTLVVTKRWITQGIRWTKGTVAFGDGALTYPTAGVPLPAKGNFGFPTTVLSMNFFGVNERTTDYHVQYGPANHTLLMYEEEAAAAGGPLLENDTAEAPAARTYSFIGSGY